MGLILSGIVQSYSSLPMDVATICAMSLQFNEDLTNVN